MVQLNVSSITANRDVVTEVLEAALTGLSGIISGANVWDLINLHKDKWTALGLCHQSDTQCIFVATMFMTKFQRMPLLPSSAGRFPSYSAAA